MYVTGFSGSVRVAVPAMATVMPGTSPAAAHWGRLAGLGGHAHWAGLALGAASAALAAGLAAVGRAKGEGEDAALNSGDSEGDPIDA